VRQGQGSIEIPLRRHVGKYSLKVTEPSYSAHAPWYGLEGVTRAVDVVPGPPAIIEIEDDGSESYGYSSSDGSSSSCAGICFRESDIRVGASPENVPLVLVTRDRHGNLAPWKKDTQVLVCVMHTHKTRTHSRLL
jgi:hypothetical protein